LLPHNINQKQNEVAGNDDPYPLLTVAEVAEYLRLNSETVRQMARQSKIPCVKVGRVWRFQRAEIELWIHLQGKTIPL
jgi:excisionase family DNA binding protein